MTSPSVAPARRSQSKVRPGRRKKRGRHSTVIPAKKSRPSGATGMPNSLDHALSVTFVQLKVSPSGQIRVVEVANVS